MSTILNIYKHFRLCLLVFILDTLLVEAAVFKKIIPGDIFDIENILNFTAKSQLACGIECLQYDHCATYIYNKKSRDCFGFTTDTVSVYSRPGNNYLFIYLFIFLFSPDPPFLDIMNNKGNNCLIFRIF